MLSEKWNSLCVGYTNDIEHWGMHKGFYCAYCILRFTFGEK